MLSVIIVPQSHRSDRNPFASRLNPSIGGPKYFWNLRPQFCAIPWFTARLERIARLRLQLSACLWTFCVLELLCWMNVALGVSLENLKIARCCFSFCNVLCDYGIPLDERDGWGNMIVFYFIQWYVAEWSTIIMFPNIIEEIASYCSISENIIGYTHKIQRIWMEARTCRCIQLRKANTNVDHVRIPFEKFNCVSVTYL